MEDGRKKRRRTDKMDRISSLPGPLPQHIVSSPHFKQEVIHKYFSQTDSPSSLVDTAHLQAQIAVARSSTAQTVDFLHNFSQTDTHSSSVDTAHPQAQTAVSPPSVGFFQKTIIQTLPLSSQTAYSRAPSSRSSTPETVPPHRFQTHAPVHIARPLSPLVQRNPLLIARDLHIFPAAPKSKCPCCSNDLWDPVKLLCNHTVNNGCWEFMRSSGQYPQCLICRNALRRADKAIICGSK